MKWPGRISSRILDLLKHPPAKPESHLWVLNTTRQTVLASCAELADRGEKRRKGLLGRTHLAPGEGLWIRPCEAVHTFGMRFSIDLVYLDRNCRVKKTRGAVPPWRLSACLTAHSVLELPSGAIGLSHTTPGDILEFSAAATLNDSSGNGSVLHAN